MEERHIRISVPEHKSKERIDTFLTREIAEVSRSQIQKAIKEGLVTIDGARVKANHQVQPSEQIDIIIPKPHSPYVLPESIPLNILFRLLVGMVV